MPRQADNCENSTCASCQTKRAFVVSLHLILSQDLLLVSEEIHKTGFYGFLILVL